MHKATICGLLLFILFVFNACGGTVASQTHNNNNHKTKILRSKIDNSRFYALEISPNSGIPIIGGNIISVDTYQSYFKMNYKENIIKVEYSRNIENISLIGQFSGRIVIIPISAKFVKINFIENNTPIIKVFEIFPNII